MTDKTVADGFLAGLAGQVDYLFANAGTDFPSIIEAIAKAEAANTPAPKAIAVPHENLAVAMAHGHTMVSGRPQAVMVHVSIGTANTLCALFNVARDRIPMLLAAGRTPITEAGAVGSRTLYIHWAQEMFDQAGMLRELVKWDYELRRPDQIETVMARAFDMAMSEPRGATYLTMPREVLAEPWQGSHDSIARAVASPPAADPSAIDAAADILAKAERPLIITAGVGRDIPAVEALGRLAERHALPVISHFARYLCLPTTHPMHLGFEPGPLLADADAILVLDCDVPWIPTREQPPRDCRVIHLGVDPLFADYPIRGFPCDLAITADPATALPALEAAVTARLKDKTSPVEERRGRLTAVRASLEQSAQIACAEYANLRPIQPGWVSHCIDAIKDDDSIVINELGLAPPHIAFPKPGTYFATSAAGALGWGLGAALGAKLAAPDRLVIAAMGDGSYMFGNPTPAHYVSAAYDLPVLFVVSNNAGWGAVRRATRLMYPEGAALKRNRVPLSTFEPSPAFEKVVEASGGYGERVDDPAELPAALERAARVVKEEGRQALVNVITGDR